MKKAFFIFLMNLIFSTSIWTNTAWSGNWNSGGKSSPFLKLLEKQPNLETALAACMPFFDTKAAFKKLNLITSVRDEKGDLIDESKDLASALLSYNLMIHYLADDNRDKTSHGKKLIETWMKSEDVYDTGSDIDMGEKVGQICTTTSNAFQVKYKNVVEDARVYAVTEMSEIKAKAVANAVGCKKQFPNLKKNAEVVGKYFTCMQK